MKINRIITNIYDSNTFVIEKGDEVLIVDAGAELEKVKSFTINKKVVGILLTHGHYDHSAYCNEYAEEFSCPIFAHEKASDTMKNKDAFYGDNGQKMEDFSRFQFTQQDCFLQIGGFNVQCITAEGHSPCCVCYKIDNILFTGDVLFENGIGRTDLVGSNKKSMLSTLIKLDDINFDKVYSGHGGQSTLLAQKKNIAIFKRFLAR